MIILKTPFCKILTQNVLIIPFNYFFQTSSGHKSVNATLLCISSIQRRVHGQCCEQLPRAVLVGTVSGLAGAVRLRSALYGTAEKGGGKSESSCFDERAFGDVSRSFYWLGRGALCLNSDCRGRWSEVPAQYDTCSRAVLSTKDTIFGCWVS